jgi:hypothetical protein
VALPDRQRDPDGDVLGDRPANRRARAGRGGTGGIRKGVAETVGRRSVRSLWPRLLGAQPIENADVLPGMGDFADTVGEIRGSRDLPRTVERFQGPNNSADGVGGIPVRVRRLATYRRIPPLMVPLRSLDVG